MIRRAGIFATLPNDAPKALSLKNCTELRMDMNRLPSTGASE
jgi:hypothetical protein